MALVTDLRVVRPEPVVLVVVAVLVALAFLLTGGGFSTTMAAGTEAGGDRSRSSTIERFRLPIPGVEVGAIAGILGGGATLAPVEAGPLFFAFGPAAFLECNESLSTSLSCPTTGVAGCDGFFAFGRGDA